MKKLTSASRSSYGFSALFFRWRYKWDIDPRTDVVAEFYQITDHRRQFENNPAPPPGSGLDSNSNAHSMLQDYFFVNMRKIHSL